MDRLDAERHLRDVHSDGNCHICGKPKAAAGASICSYPHGMLPTGPVDPRAPRGFWAWQCPVVETTL